MTAQTNIATREDNAPAPAGHAVATPMEMLSHALQNGATPEMLKSLLDLQERWERNQGRRAFDEAMAQAKAEIPVINKNREVDFTSPKGRTHYRHEDLAEIARVINPILGKHGLSYRFRTSSNPNEPVTVTCIVSHRQGYSEENTLSAGKDESGNKNSIQAVGSTLTYLQRMTLKAALGLAASDDDDGRRSDAGQSISDDQLAEIRKLVDEKQADVPRFCNYLKVPSLAEIPASRFNDAVAALKAKGQK